MARILISMTDEFLNRVDSVANSEQRTRSELIREALRSYVKKNRMTNPQKAMHNAEKLNELLG
ncbi:ribbon-helix-helix protein, CopG family [bacterium]|nr:ribbon-helix-helix protein, CopG family [bacterium]